MRSAVVTAGTGGIGLETAVGLAEAGFRVTVVGRNPDRGAAAVERITAAAPERPARFLAADLSSLGEVRALADRIAADGPLAVLVNNVGAMFPERRDNVDGVEASFAVNHLSPYLLTELLLPSLEAGAPSRVVAVTSGAIRVAKRSFGAVEPTGGYYGFHWYGRAKLLHLAYALDLARRLDGTGISVFAADPGGAATDMTDGTMRDPRIVTPGLRLLWPLVRRTFDRATSGSAAAAARSSIAAATDPSLDGRTGVVLGPDARPVRPFHVATDPRVVEAVRGFSERWAPTTAVVRRDEGVQPGV
ncbi:SDR family NAD(P)-dependent oxidoreductase [Actinosynnema sp. NPDC053489]|uniref:SDR family NAD(P)-dependent oxidoreductase n=1 Tax=Actinosynnema sp. NPDC053489 TaxID=3363916 RepID=UPI0037C83E7A